MTAARRLYRLHMVLAGFGLLVALVAAAVAVGRLSLGAPSPRSLAAACDRWVPELAVGQALVLGLAILTAVVAALALRSLRRQVGPTRRCISRLAPSCEPVELAGAPCRIFRDAEPHAFCGGLLFPRVYVSTGAFELLHEDELRAVVAHEGYHARRRDPLRIVVARVLADAFFFLPALRRIAERYAALAEVAADEAAVKAGSGTSALASALLRFDEHGQGADTVGISPERVDALAGDERAGGWNVSKLFTLASAAIGGALIAAAVIGQGAGDSPLSLPLLAAQSCMLIMATVPAAAALSGLLLVRRIRAT